MFSKESINEIVELLFKPYTMYLDLLLESHKRIIKSLQERGSNTSNKE